MNQQLEYAVLGTAMMNPNVIPEILSKVTPADLWNPKAEAVLSAVADMWAEGITVDSLGVAQRVSGGKITASDIFQMVESACPPGAVATHLNTIAEAATIRRLGDAGQRISTLASSGETSGHIIQHAQELLDGVVRSTDSDVALAGDTIDDTFDKIWDRQNGNEDSGLPTGFPDLDELIGGLAGGQMIIVAARPGVGKSTLAVDFIRHASIKQNIPSMIFSLEMGRDELNQRIIAAEASVLLKNIVSGSMDDQDWDKAGSARDRIKAAPIFVDTTEETTVHDITAKARMYVEKHNVGLIVVDYLQLLRSGQRMESREQEIATYSRAMKLLAKACDVPVVVIAQLNREAVRRGGAPQVSDLRESGSLEQDADVIMLIDRPEMTEPDGERAGEADVIVGKNRRGRTGKVTVASQLHYSRFRSLVRAA